MNTLTENRKAVWFYSLHKYEWANYSFKVLGSAQFFFKVAFFKKNVSIWDELLLSNKHLTHVLFLLCSQKTFQPNSSSHWVRHCNKLSTPVRTFPTSIVDRAARWNCVNLSLSFGMKTLQSFFFKCIWWNLHRRIPHAGNFIPPVSVYPLSLTCTGAQSRTHMWENSGGGSAVVN